MKKLILLFAFLIIASPVFARDCYVKNGGSDVASGLDDTNAYATLSKVLSSCSTSGDMVYLKRGSAWDETMYTKTGVTYQDYSTGDLPRVSRICNFSSACSSQHDFVVKNINVTLTSAMYPFTIRGGYNIEIDNVYVFSAGFDNLHTGILFDDGGSSELTFPYNITVKNSFVAGFTKGIGGEARDVLIMDNTIYNPGDNSAGIEPTGSESGTDATKYPRDWLITGNIVICNDSRYENNGIGERGINIGWLASRIVVDGNYVSGCGVTNTGFDYSIDYNTGSLGTNVISNNISAGSGWNALFIQTAANSTNASLLGKVFNAKVIGNVFYPSSSTDAFARTVRFLENATNNTPADVEFKNNIIMSKSATIDIMRVDDTQGSWKSDNNLYYNITGEAVQFNYNGSSHATLAAFRAASGRDDYSIALQDPLVDPSLYTLGDGSPAIGLGDTTTGIRTDATGANRGLTFDAGAYQKTFGPLKKITGGTIKGGSL